VTTLAELTTLRVGGPIGRLTETTSEKALIAAVSEADAAREPVLVLGRGSNVVAGDAVFSGLVVRDTRAEITVTDASACAGTSLTVTAGTPWDDVVARAVEEGWVGVETLSGIPGSTGATPVQNVGAYGQEVAQSIALVRTWDRGEARIRTMALVDLHFSYRDSVLKRSLRTSDGALSEFAPTPRHVVLDVTFQLRFGTVSDPIRYPELARMLGIEVGERAPLGDVRAAVLALRGGQRDGPRPSRPRHLERRFVLHQPAAQRRRRSAAPSRGAPVPGRRRADQDERGVADRAGRLRSGLRASGSGGTVDQTHPRDHQPWRRDECRRAGLGA